MSKPPVVSGIKAITALTRVGFFIDRKSHNFVNIVRTFSIDTPFEAIIYYSPRHEKSVK